MQHVCARMGFLMLIRHVPLVSQDPCEYRFWLDLMIYYFNFLNIRCVGGARTACPLHYYQDMAQATSCKTCTTTGDTHGKAVINCGAGQLLAWCDPTITGTQDTPLGRNCLPCKQCIRPYLPYVEGQQNCYTS